MRRSAKVRTNERVDYWVPQWATDSTTYGLLQVEKDYAHRENIFQHYLI